jgi:hypothetical protein
MNRSTPPLRIRRIAKPTPPPPPPPAVAAEPPKPAETPKHPRRLRRYSFAVPGIFVGGPGWGSPFRTQKVDGQWFAVWVGDDMHLAQYKPRDWHDRPCGSRLEAAQTAQDAFRAWITSPDTSGLLSHARTSLAGRNLVCSCGRDYPCHGDVLLELVNLPGESPAGHLRSNPGDA